MRSRPAKDRRAAHQTVVAALSRVNDTVESVTPLRPTVGDEFQGVYAQLGQALRAAFLLRVDLAPDIDVRFGIARGAVEDLDVERGQGGKSSRATVSTMSGRSISMVRRTISEFTVT